jgi:carboxyl-terminal processing protease
MAAAHPRGAKMADSELVDLPGKRFEKGATDAKAKIADPAAPVKAAAAASSTSASSSSVSK